MVARSCAGCMAGAFTSTSTLLSPAVTDWRCKSAGAALDSPKASTLSKPCSDRRAFQPSLHILQRSTTNAGP